MSKMRLCFLVLFAGLFSFSSAHAILIEADFNSDGDGLITRDTETGLEWLDLNQTVNYSYNAMLAELGTGGKFDGFRYATVSDIDTLQQSAGLASGLFYSSSAFFYRSEMAALMDLVGITDVTSPYKYSYGLTSNPFTGTTLNDRIVRYFAMSPIIVSTRQAVVSDDFSNNWLGSWLIRDTVQISAPNVLVLTMLGFIALLTSRKRLS